MLEHLGTKESPGHEVAQLALGRVRRDDPEFQANLRYIETKTLSLRKKGNGERREGKILTLQASKWKIESLTSHSNRSRSPIS